MPTAVQDNPLEFRSTLAHPQDVTYQLERRKKINTLLRYSAEELKQMLRIAQMQPAPRDETGVQQTMARELRSAAFIPDSVKNILGTTSGTGESDGSALVRQDLEPIIYALFVKQFPFYEMIPKEPANGLVHAFDQMVSPDPNTTSTSNTISTVVSDLGTVGFTASDYVRQTANIAVFALGRGVGFKELAAVRQGGMAWNPEKLELSAGMVKLAYDLQTMLAQGNGTYASGTGANEGGAYNNTYFDGLRLILGSVAGSNYASNNAIQMEQGSLNLTQTIKAAVAKAAQAGGLPDVVVMSINAKEQLDQENETNKRYNDNLVEVIPGVQVNQIAWANGILKVLPVPGFSFGTYTSPVSGQTVEDVYFLQTDSISMPWLYAEGFTVLELPAAVDYTLSQRYIIFSMSGLAVKTPLFMGKARRPA